MNKMKIGAIIQARMSSSRLPGKVLMPLPFPWGAPILRHIHQRLESLQRGKLLEEIVVATSVDPRDDAIELFGRNNGISVERGPLEDVLARFVQVIETHAWDAIVRVTGDNPCLDPVSLARGILRFQAGDLDYLTNSGQGFPLGVDWEIVSCTALRRAHREAMAAYEREHVLPYIYDTCASDFRLGLLQPERGEYAPEIRVTVDQVEDYAVASMLFSYFDGRDTLFSCKEMIKFFGEFPHIQNLNGRVIQKGKGG